MELSPKRSGVGNYPRREALWDTFHVSPFTFHLFIENNLSNLLNVDVLRAGSCVFLDEYLDWQ